MLHRQKPFADNMQPRSRHEMMNIGDPAGERIVDRNHPEHGATGAHRGKGVLEGRTRQRLVARIGFVAGDMRIRAEFALECNFFRLLIRPVLLCTVLILRLVLLRLVLDILVVAAADA